VASRERDRIDACGEISTVVARVAAGEAHALADLYDRSSSLVFSLAMRILGRQDEAEEVVLDVFAQVWKTARTFDSRRGSAEAWLTTMTRSRALDRRRYRTARPDADGADTTGLERLDTMRARGTRDPFAADHARLQAEAILRVLLPEERRLVELAYFEGLTHAELAARLGLPLGTVKTKIRNSVLKMRARLLE
jgi:RNA polymerase sigma-70 factor (ECF subfamily)